MPDTEKKYDKKPVVSVVTPVGTLAYSWINKPDEGKKFSDGKFKANLCIPKDAIDLTWAVGKEQFKGTAKQFVTALAKLSAKDRIIDGDAFAKKKDKPEFAGCYMFQAKTKQKPNVVDSKRKPVPASVLVMSGDRAKLAIGVNEYDPGKFNFYLNAVQLIEKRARSGFDGADAFGEEEGFEAGDSDETSTENGEPAGSPDDDIDF